MIWYGRGKLSNASSVKAEAVRRRKDKVQTKTEISFPANIEGRERSGAGQFVSTYEIGFGIRLLSSSLANVVELVESLVDVVSVIEEGNGWTRKDRMNNPGGQGIELRESLLLREGERECKGRK
ncbi:hypothetical protein FOQG_08166 [Fusarium oxysporum f. sp. raphani 54005]|uniref:Uncharacterized protein n=3 Tax=Fusarium oxysporum TaxID=5507 RepID=X0D2K1_FUSOX|nr:hypothetical protein FOVG_05849 [Fusarium oxysporum f. sp. pisi HDV247]EXK88902.1 hypothetical protein FOQG_08166 [Fusarium oxysporum f. sp. raphani 54005]EXM16326.1 hypothetical protein FOTG_15336 [Fusarium oxysporum f. sp. vasinfectum 25433]